VHETNGNRADEHPDHKNLRRVSKAVARTVLGRNVNAAINICATGNRRLAVGIPNLYGGEDVKGGGYCWKKSAGSLIAKSR